MWLYSIGVLFIYGAPIALLGLINLAYIPGWRVTVANLLVFVFGGLLGTFVLYNLVAWILRHVSGDWGIQGRQANYVAFYLIIIVGSELGGAGLIYLKSRFRKSS